MKKYIILLFLGVVAINIQAQFRSDSIMSDSLIQKKTFKKMSDIGSFSGYAPSIIHSSPQSQIFEKHLKHEITEYNGLPSISIPLYEIEIDGLKIPIKLSYHAAGVKFMQYDGDIAAGWSINAGGYRVSRTILGGADEKNRMYSEDSLQIVYAAHYNQKEEYPRQDQRMVAIYRDLTEAHLVSTSFGKYRYPEGECDLFNCFLPSTNSHFIISDRTKKKVEIIEQNLDRIILDPNVESFPLENIDITDSNGYRYFLGGDYIERDNTPGKNKTAWPLIHIRSPHGEQIANFEYKNYGIKTTPADWITSYNLMDAGVEQYLVSIEGIDCPGKNDKYGNYTSYENISETQYAYNEASFISKIKTKFVDVEFIRRNLITGFNADKYRLEEIKITDKKGVILKKIKFNYTKKDPYFHVLLKSITTEGLMEISSEYNFDYYLPQEGTTFIADQWGYYKSEKNINKPYMGVASEFFHEEMKDDTYLRCYTAYANKTPTQEIKKVGSDVPWAFYNRTTNDYPHHFSLKQISYPTGGITTYKYEPNQYEGIKSGGGQRIAKIVSDPNDGLTPPITTVFKYGKDENGLGVPNFDYDHNLFKSETVYYDQLYIDTSENWVPGNSPYPHHSIIATKVRSFSPLTLGSLESYFSVKYPQIATYQYENDQSNGKIISSFNIQEQYIIDEMSMVTGIGGGSFSMAYDTYLTAKNIKEYRLGYKPLLIRRASYNANNTLIKDEEFRYKKVAPVKDSYLGLKALRGIVNNVEYVKGVVEFSPGVEFNRMLSEIKLGTDLLSEKTTSLYNIDGSSSQKTLETYTYDARNRIREKTAHLDSQNQLITEYSYPPLGSALDQQNMNSVIIETLTKNRGKEVSKVKTIYDDESILPSSIEETIGNTPRTVIRFEKYNSSGKILQYTTLDGLTTCYVWPNIGDYPIAEIKNATYQEVSHILNNTNFPVGIEPYPSEVVFLSMQDKLRSKLPNALVTTYTYKPLVGILTATDPRGVTTYYDYVGFGRLKETYIIEKGVKKVLQGYDYNYRNK